MALSKLKRRERDRWQIRTTKYISGNICSKFCYSCGSRTNQISGRLFTAYYLPKQYAFFLSYLPFNLLYHPTDPSLSYFDYGFNFSPSSPISLLFLSVLILRNISSIFPYFASIIPLPLTLFHYRFFLASSFLQYSSLLNSLTFYFQICYLRYLALVAPLDPFMTLATLPLCVLYQSYCSPFFQYVQTTEEYFINPFNYLVVHFTQL